MQTSFLFVDRDGTLLWEPPDTKQINGLEQMRFLPGVISALKAFSAAGYEIVIVSNQDGLGTPANPRKNYDTINQKMQEILASEDILISKILTCPHLPEDRCQCRKPNLGLIAKYPGFDAINYQTSLMVGDRESDLELARALKIQGFLITETPWKEIVKKVFFGKRCASIHRKTKETDIQLSLCLDGSGEMRFTSGIPFFDHLLHQLIFHAQFSLEGGAKGDLEVEVHHTVEDIAIALGKALKKALPHRNIQRYHWEWILPMDEARSFVALDFSGRGFCRFEPSIFPRPFIEHFPTEMVPHFFQTLCVNAGINAHIHLTGENTHHLLEATFKAFGRCLRQALKRESLIPTSTKGLLA